MVLILFNKLNIHNGGQKIINQMMIIYSIHLINSILACLVYSLSLFLGVCVSSSHCFSSSKPIFINFSFSFELTFIFHYFSFLGTHLKYFMCNHLLLFSIASVRYKNDFSSNRLYIYNYICINNFAM